MYYETAKLFGDMLLKSQNTDDYQIGCILFVKARFADILGFKNLELKLPKSKNYAESKQKVYLKK